MAITAEDVQTLHDYAAGVMSRADRHAGEVKAIALALLGGIIWRAEPGSIEIKQYAGGLANVLWFVTGGNRYAVAYNHDTQKIEIRARKQSGQALHSFDNQTPVATVEAVFAKLWPRRGPCRKAVSTMRPAGEGVSAQAGRPLVHKSGLMHTDPRSTISVAWSVQNSRA